MIARAACARTSKRPPRSPGSQTASPRHSATFPLLRALRERGIEHIIVGGFAVNAHGFIRVTRIL
jgi:hypothetical protein